LHKLKNNKKIVIDHNLQKPEIKNYTNRKNKKSIRNRRSIKEIDKDQNQKRTENRREKNVRVRDLVTKSRRRKGIIPILQIENISQNITIQEEIDNIKYIFILNQII
jgi:hypothetical protein